MLTTRKLIKSAGGSVFRFLLKNTFAFQNICIVLMYHRVVVQLPKDLYDRDLCVTKDTFEMHMNLLHRFFTVVPIEQIVHHKPAGRICAITFDDGWLDNYQVAYPILKKYQLPATIFLPVQLIGTNKWFWFEAIWALVSNCISQQKKDRFISYFKDHIPSWKCDNLSTPSMLQLIEKLKLMNATQLEKIVHDMHLSMELRQPIERILLNWEEAVEMGKNGITFGSHGLHHRILPSLNFNEKEKEINDSLNALMEHNIPIARFFCYPNGDWDDDCLDILSNSKYQGAVTTQAGLNGQNTNLFLLNRIGIHEDISCSSSLFFYRLYQACMQKIAT